MFDTSTKRMRFARALGLVAVACMLAGGTMLPAAPAHAATTLTLWAPYSGPDGQAFISIVEGFNKSQSAINVNYDRQSNTGYGDKVTAALAAGRGPNMWVGDNVGMAGWAGQHHLSPLEKLIKSSKVLNPKNFFKGGWSGTQFQGHTYSLPLDALPATMFYNKDLFRKAHLNPNSPPTTTQASFLKTAKKLTKGTSQYGFFVPSEWPVALVWTSVFYQFGGKLFDVKQQKAMFNSKAGVQAIQAMYNLIYKDKVSPAKVGGTDPDMRMVATGQAAMVVDGPWQSNHPSLKAMGAKAGVAPFPQIGPKKAVAFYSHYLVSYYKNTADENAAVVKFAEYFNQHSLLMGKAGDAPMYKPVFNSKALQSLPKVKAITRMMKYATPAGPTSQKYKDAPLFADVITPAMQGKIKPADFKSALDKAANTITQSAQGG